MSAGLPLHRLFAPVPILPLVYLRVMFGAIMLWEVWRYFNNGWIKRYYIDPEMFFTYFGFGWVRPLPGDWMYAVFYALGGLAVSILLGAAYRVTMPLFFLTFTYIFLLDQTNYLNHFYLISLVSFLMIFVPAHRALSLDAWLRPAVRARTAPAWTLGILRFQLGIVYIFGGIAKLNGDWLRGEPMRLWLAARTDFPLIGQYFTEEWMVYAFSYGGLLIDLFAVPLLFVNRLRWLALAALVAFHLTNARLFNIGIFPWFMLATLPLFLPLRWWERLWPGDSGSAAPFAHRRVLVTLLALYCAAQILIPLRHFLYPGDPSWTEEGHKFAWHMRLRDKQSVAVFHIKDPESGQEWRVTPGVYLTRRQAQQMPDRPEMILQFSHFLAQKWRERGVQNPMVYAYALVSLNGRDYQLIVDPSVNLAEKSPSLLAADWILPLEQPLK